MPKRIIFNENTRKVISELMDKSGQSDSIPIIKSCREIKKSISDTVNDMFSDRDNSKLIQNVINIIKQDIRSGKIQKPYDPEENKVINTPEMIFTELMRFIFSVAYEAALDTSKKRRPSSQFMELANSAIYYYTREIIAKGGFARETDEKWPTGHIRLKDLIADVQIKPDPAAIEPYLAKKELTEWQEKAADIALEMDDETADVLDYITYEVINQAKTPEQDVAFSSYGFYELRGIQKQKSAGTGRRGGYKTEYRRHFARNIEKLDNTWIRVAEMDVIEPDEKGKRKKSKKHGIESRAIVISARAGQLNLGGRIEPDTFRGHLGPLFAASIFGTWRQTALVSIKALAYDPYRQLPEKRLTRYLSWQWRIRQSAGNYLQSYEVSTLLESAGIEVSKKNPTQTKDRLEKALDTLAQDHVISCWQYCDGWDEDIVGKRNWTDKWQCWKIAVEPPQEIFDQYKEIPTIEAAVKKPLPTSDKPIGEQLKDCRVIIGYTQMQAAEEVGITQQTLSRIERGAKPSIKIQKKIKYWIERVNDAV